MPSARRKRVATTDVQLTVRIPRALHAQLTKHAKDEDLAVAQVVRRALREHLDSA